MVNIVGKILWVVESMLVLIIVLAIVVLSYNFYQLNVAKKDYVSFMGYAVFEVVSNSMAPEINIDDVVIVKIDVDVIENDVITYQRDNAFITHRVVDVQRNYIIAQGDANNKKDAPIAPDAVVGKVIRVIPTLGTWRKVIVDPTFILGVVGVLGIMNYVVFKNKGTIIPSRKKYMKDFKITHNNIIEEKNDKK